MAEQREHDIVLFGATGFTGGLTAEYLANNAPAGLRWAIAGRDRGKLEGVRERLGAASANAADLPLLQADVTDRASLEAIARSARVVITTVGPYINYGEGLVGACAAAGTDYVDLTGEPEFVDLMYVRHHARAAETGARIVHCCGFDSIPHDLGALFTVEQLPEDVPLTVEGFVRSNGRPSGGTMHSAITAFARARQLAQASRERHRLEPRPEERRIRSLGRAPRYEREIGAWAVPLPTIDPVIVRRSARALERYGPDFGYGHYAAVKRLPMVIGGAAGVAGLFAAAQVPPLRKALLGRISPGEGPSAERRERSWFKVDFIGEGGGRRVRTRVSGGDPGYSETSKMLAESGLCLARDELPQRAGQLTPAAAMGSRLTERLQRAGIAFEVLDT